MDNDTMTCFHVPKQKTLFLSLSFFIVAWILFLIFFIFLVWSALRTRSVMTDENERV